MPPTPSLHRPRRARRLPYHILFEDSHLLVADKAPGVLTVPIPEKRSPNLKELLDDHLASQKREAFPVHRIDRHTSGLVVFAKNRRAWKTLADQFRARTPERTYLALVRGRVADDEGTLRHRLELTTDGFRQRVVREGGTEAVTHYRVLERFAAATLLEIRLESGLKNQIRVQFRAAGHPLVGDRHYAPEEAAEVSLQRQALHAWKLGFLHPATGERVSFEAPLAPDMKRLLARLRSAPRAAPTPPSPAISAPPPEAKRPGAKARPGGGRRLDKGSGQKVRYRPPRRGAIAKR